jgi:hypothetical protein
MRDPRDETAVHSLGAILVRMKALTRTELAVAVKEQESMTREQLLGELLINRGLITRAQLAVALEAQENLRSKKPHVRALAAARLAEISGGNVVQLAAATRAESALARKRITGEGHPAVRVEEKK